MGYSIGTHSGGAVQRAARDLGRVSRAATPLYLRNRVSWSRQTGPLHPSESPPDRLRDLADYIRAIPFYEESLADRLRSAARLLRLAIKSGAFSDAEYEPFHVALRRWIGSYQRGNRQQDFNEHIVFRNPPDGLIGAWGEANWWLRGRPEEKRDIWATFAEDCEFIAWLIDVETVRQMTRAQYQDYCETQGHTDLAENNRAYWREVEAAIQSGKPMPPQVLAECKQVWGGK